ncbi:MAG: hypothetical protein COU85_01065 [Candidatus Portnoybacteria bacterium CG10_big_fil_rev_8_21_14_0_10_44_7]|uniref:Thioredoxin domain-containing protein n=1 Tax=Candidatus Portnoybacteria bacterium CG10_big_fil_rev_8_21_14_0_10_44_7 TaxID=1974816 RepID=A0A2M8KJ46_9BACT|nr:MAG: hypothetical protein COU85_01065 [Candidatus Portnoybacteria bacterium CG10_big_fil_rev_8_21_14_0_10_44_7]
MKKSNFILIIFAVIVLGGLLVYGKYYYQKTTDVDKDNQVIAFAQGFVVGNPDAPVVVEEFMSYLCGHCLNFTNDTFPPLKEKYVDSEQVQFHVFVMPPVELSAAALCAADQNNFLAFHDYFTGHVASELKTADDIKIMTQKSGLDMALFNECYDSDKFSATLAAWDKIYQQKNVTSTPTFFVNGQLISGNQPINVFESAIDQALGK